MHTKTSSITLALALILTPIAGCDGDGAENAEGAANGANGAPGDPAPSDTPVPAQSQAGAIRGDVVLSPSNDLYPRFDRDGFFDGYLVSRLSNDRQYLSAEFLVDGGSAMAGAVTMNGNPLEISSDGDGYFSYVPDDPGFPGTRFDGSAHAWRVTGGEGALAFEHAVPSPTARAAIAIPKAQDEVPRAGFTVRWSGTEGEVLVQLAQFNAAYRVTAARGKLTSGSELTFSEADLEHFEDGKVTLRVIQLRHETVTTADGRAFKLISATDDARHVVLR